MKFVTLILFFFVLPGFAEKENPLSLELELDAYYSDVALYVPLSDKEIEAALKEEELKAYIRLLRSSFIPKFLVLEGSLNPLPTAGVLIRRNTPGFYNRADYSNGQNLIRAVTAGFEEPYAVSIFLGNVIDFSPGQKDLKRKNKGYMGYLISVGDYHIQDSVFIYDPWLELEMKIKGDQNFPSRKLGWSFRVGAKIHKHPEIRDLLYLGLRRSRTDFEGTAQSLFHNAGFEYTFSMDTTGTPIEHKVLIDKKFPLGKKRMVFSFGLGFLWKAKENYLGKLAQQRVSSTSQIILQPNLQF